MSGRVVKRAFRYRFYPTTQQADLLNRTFGSVRYVWNRALAERHRAWTQEQKRLTYVDTAKMLTTWKQDPDTAWLSEVSNVALQQALRHLQAAFVNFWTKRARYPRFKSKRASRASATFMTNAFTLQNGQLILAKMSAPLNIRWSRPLPAGAEPSSVTVSRDRAGRWFVSILCQDVVRDGPATDTAVGVDAGISSLVTLSTGEKITNPRHEKRDRKRLRRAQQALHRKQQGSANRAKAKLMVARIQARIADRRRDALHKLTTRLVREHRTVVIENLAVCNLVRNHSLARAISDASWAQLRSMLEYKAEWYGRRVVAVDRFFPSSKTCSACGAITTEKLPLNIREWTCPCGAVHDRDVNAARVIRAEGLSVLACGDGVRPPRS